MKRFIFLKIILTFYLLITLSSCDKSNDLIPRDFIETIPPKHGSKETYALNIVNQKFKVEILGKKLVISKPEEESDCVLNIQNGKLIGVDNGEWGGTLTFVPNDTTKSIIEIKKGNIKFIFTFKDKIYFIEGLAHMSLSEGAIYQLDYINNIFLYNKLIDFEDAPEAYTIFNDKLLIAGYQSFYVVKDFKKELIFKDAFWSGLMPNSIAVLDEKNVFLGTKGGVVKINLKTKTFKFYKYEKKSNK